MVPFSKLTGVGLSIAHGIASPSVDAQVMGILLHGPLGLSLKGMCEMGGGEEIGGGEEMGAMGVGFLTARGGSVC